MKEYFQEMHFWLLEGFWDFVVLLTGFCSYRKDMKSHLRKDMLTAPKECIS